MTSTTPANKRIAQEVDRVAPFDRDVLLKQRAAVELKLSSPGGDRERLLEQLHAVLFAGHKQESNFVYYNPPKDVPHSPGGNLRWFIEKGIAGAGSVEKALDSKAGLSGSSSSVVVEQRTLIEKDAKWLREEFTRQAYDMANRVLEGSLQSITDMLRDYGLPPMVYSAIDRLRHGATDAEQEAKDWILIAHAGSRKAAFDVGEKHRANLQGWARTLTAEQRKIADLKQHLRELEQESIGAGAGSRAPTTTDPDTGLPAPDLTAVRDAREELAKARKTFASDWQRVEAHHPLLSQYRTRSGAELEGIDLSDLAVTDEDERMRRVVARVLPTIVDIDRERPRPPSSTHAMSE